MHGLDRIPGVDQRDDPRDVEEVPVQVLQDEREAALAGVGGMRFGHGAGGRRLPPSGSRRRGSSSRSAGTATGTAARTTRTAAATAARRPAGSAARTRSPHRT